MLPLFYVFYLFVCILTLLSHSIFQVHAYSPRCYYVASPRSTGTGRLKAVSCRSIHSAKSENPYYFDRNSAHGEHADAVVAAAVVAENGDYSFQKSGWAWGHSSFDEMKWWDRELDSHSRDLVDFVACF